MIPTQKQVYPPCIGRLLNPSRNHQCNKCNFIDGCRERFAQKLKRYVTVDKKSQHAHIDFDLNRFALELNDSGLLALDTLFVKFADDKSEFEHGQCSGTFKMPTATHADFYRGLIHILTTLENLTCQNQYIEWTRD